MSTSFTSTSSGGATKVAPFNVFNRGCVAFGLGFVRLHPRRHGRHRDRLRNIERTVDFAMDASHPFRLAEFRVRGPR